MTIRYIMLSTLLMGLCLPAWTQVRYTVKPFVEIKGKYDSSIPIPDTLYNSVYHDTASYATSVNGGASINLQAGKNLLLQAGYEYLGEFYADYSTANWQQHELSLTSRYVVSPQLLVKMSGSGNYNPSSSRFYRSQGAAGTMDVSYIFPYQLFSEIVYGLRGEAYPDLWINTHRRDNFIRQSMDASIKKYLQRNATITGALAYERKDFTDAPLYTVGGASTDSSENELDETYAAKVGYLQMLGEKALLKGLAEGSRCTSNDTNFTANDYQLSAVCTYTIYRNVLLQVLGKYKNIYYAHRLRDNVHQVDQRYTGSLDLNWTYRKIYTVGLSYFWQKNDSNWISERYVRNIMVTSVSMKY